MTCRSLVLLISWTMAQSVVVLPEPVGPVTSTRPLLSIESFLTDSGRPSCSIVGRRLGMMRKTAPSPRDWTKTLARKRATPSSA